MSSSDELGWDAFSPRDVEDGIEIRSPAAEMAGVLQRYRNDVDTLVAQAAEARIDSMRALADQAVLAVQLESALALYETRLFDAAMGKVHQHLRIIKDRMIQGTEAAGLEVVRLVGLPYDEVAGMVEVDGWLHREELVAEVVLEANEPAVRSNGAVLRLGRVVMGAPMHAAPEAPAQDDAAAPA